MYEILANFVDFIHLIVIIFMLAGLVLPFNTRFKRFKTFHSFFCIFVVISQALCGVRCPLVIISQNLRHLGNPEYEVTCNSFVQEIIFNKFNISVPAYIIFLVILLCGGLGAVYLLSKKILKKENAET